MSFWEAALSYKETPLSKHAVSQISTLSPDISPPPGCEAAVVATSPADRLAVREFLEQTFGSPPHSPRLLARFSEDDLILVSKSSSDPSVLCGCIRISYAGHFETAPIFVADCFCIAPSLRKRGLGSYILFQIQKETSKRGMGHVIMLKESSSVLDLRRPIYSSHYVFCQNSRALQDRMEQVRSLTHQEALSLVAIYKEMYPETFVLCAQTVSKNREILWRFWKRGLSFILASFQDSFQIHPQTHTAIGWATGWLELPCPTITATPSQEYKRQQVISAIISSLPYDWVWADRAWIRPTEVKGARSWQPDGPFHWYPCQWQPLIRPNGSYILHV